MRTASDFDAFVESFGWANFPYDESLSNAVRTNVTPRVFTANEAPPTATIRLHHELAQTPRFPSHLFFFCERPAERGGATALCRSDALFEAIACELIAAFAWADRRNDPSRSVVHGDGSPVDVAAAARVAELAETLAVDLDWQAGDVALVDNLCVMHGRRSFAGARRVLASLVA